MGVVASFASYENMARCLYHPHPTLRATLPARGGKALGFPTSLC